RRFVLVESHGTGRRNRLSERLHTHDLGAHIPHRVRMRGGRFRFLVSSFLASDCREYDQCGRTVVNDFHGCCSPAGADGRGAPTASSSAASASFAAPRASTYWLSAASSVRFASSRSSADEPPNP